MTGDDDEFRHEEISRWFEVWTEQNAHPKTLPEDSKPCIDAQECKNYCLVAAEAEGYSEKDLCNIDFVEGDLAMFFDGILRKKFTDHLGR